MTSRPTLSGIDTALERALEVLSSRPAALITDIDGTISPIVARPEDAAVTEIARRALATLAQQIELVAVVTARDEATARSMVRLDGLAYVGNYALDDKARALLDLTGLDGAKASIVELLTPWPCVVIEEKGVSFALHYRNCEDADAMRGRLLALVEPVAIGAGCRLLEGKRVIEVVPAGLPDKGSAVAELLRSYAVRSVVYLGDDVSDLAVFRELTRLRTKDGTDALSIAVVDAETHGPVAEAADLTLAGVGEVEVFLAELAQTLTKGGVL